MPSLSLRKIIEITGGTCLYFHLHFQGTQEKSDVPDILLTGVSTDSRSIRNGDLFIPLTGDNFDGHHFVGQAFSAGSPVSLVSRPVDLSPGVFGVQVLVPDTLIALQSLARWYRSEFRGKVISVTGANGKTTTKEMLFHVLSGCFKGRASPKSYNNHIGVPLTLLSAEPDDDFLVVEIGTNHLGEVGPLASMVEPEIAVVTSLSESHLEGLKTIEGVAEEELSPLGFRKPGGPGIVNADHPLLFSAAKKAEKPIFTFGQNPESALRVHDLKQEGDGIYFRLNSMPCFLKGIGLHNAVNAAAVYLAAHFLGVPDEVIHRQWQTFQPPPGRMNLVKTNDFVLIDDAYNANPGSMKAGLETLVHWPVAPNGRRLFICGDMRELGSESEKFHEELGRSAAALGVDVVVAVGDFADFVTKGFLSVRKAPVFSFARSEEAAAEIFSVVKTGDVILLKGSRKIGLEAIGARLVKGCEVRK